jgi:hypothetical protein
MIGTGKNENVSVTRLRPLIWVLAIGAMLFASACGGDDTATNNTRQYPTGISDDIYKQLKYDARVQDYEEQGNTLIVNVNDSWMTSPPGMRERALGQWYGLWRNAHGNQDDLKIEVRHEGNALDSWSGEKGYQPASNKKASSESQAEG